MQFGKTKKVDVLIFVFIMLAAGSVALLLGKDANWDLRNYHYYNGYAFLTGRLDYDIAPAQLQTYLNPLLDVFVYLGIKYLPAKVFGFILGAIHGIGIWLVYKLTRLVTRGYLVKSSVLIAILAAVTAFLGAGWFSELGNTMGDNIVGIFVLSALLLVLSCPSPITLSDGKRALIGAGFLMGVGTGLKLVAGVYFAGFFISIAFLMDKPQIVRQYAVLSASFAAGIAVSIGFWMIKLWVKFQNPLFPFYNKIFKSPFFEPTNFHDYRFFPKSLAQQLFYPMFFVKEPTLVSENVFRDFRFPVLYVVIILFLLWSTYRFLLNRNQMLEDSVNDKHVTYFLLSFTAISYVGWQMMFSIYRYVIPLELLTPVVIIAVLSFVLKSSKQSIRIASGMFFFLIITVRPIDWGKHSWHNRDAWNNNYFSLNASAPLTKFEHTTILMSGEKPTSFVIPFFPKSTRFVRMGSYLTWPSDNKGMGIEIDKAIHESKSLKFFLTESSEAEAAKAHNVYVDLNSCDSFAPSMGDEFLLCDASKGK